MGLAHSAAEGMNFVDIKWNVKLYKHKAGMYKNLNVKKFPSNSGIILVKRGSLEQKKAPL